MAAKKQPAHSESASDAEKLGERLRIVRGKAQRDAFAGRFGISLASLGNYERGDREPGALLVAQIAADTGCDLVWLLTGEGQPWPQDRAAVPFDPEKMRLAVDIATTLDQAGRLPAGMDVSNYATLFYEFFTGAPVPSRSIEG